MNVPTELICARCKAVKPVSDFYKRQDTPTGYKSICKGCFKIHWRTVSYPKIKNREWYRTGKQKTSARYRNNYPEKQTAHVIARQNKATLLKSECEHCGKVEKLHMHHPDYSRPMYVITLCKDCHLAVHQEGIKV